MKFTKKFFKSVTAAVLSSAIFLGSTCFQTASAEEGALFRNINQILEAKRGLLERLNVDNLYRYISSSCNVVRESMKIEGDTDFIGILEKYEDRFTLDNEMLELRACCQVLEWVDCRSFEYRSILVKAFIHAEIIKKILDKALEVSYNRFSNRFYTFVNIDYYLKNMVLFLYSALNEPNRIGFWGYIS